MAESRSRVDKIVEEIQNSTSIPEEEKQKFLKRFLDMRENKINMMITGATGSGKSSTISALFGKEIAKIGVGVDPETMEIKKYEFGNLILWDSPGLGDGKDADTRHAKNIIDKLHEKDDNGELLIDLVLVILDASSRDMGTSFELINKVIIPELGEDPSKRILVALNQADLAMKGKHWDHETHSPDDELIKTLDDKAASVKRRILESTGVSVDPIYYSAGYKEEGHPQEPAYNLSKLFSYIIKMVPAKKRLSLIDNMNERKDVWESDDKREDYGKAIENSFMETVVESIEGGSDIGARIGRAMGGEAGEAVGRFVGGAAGAVAGAVKGLWKKFFG